MVGAASNFISRGSANFINSIATSTKAHLSIGFIGPIYTHGSMVAMTTTRGKRLTTIKKPWP
jgi:hypothetical protein